ncbi:MAG: helix-turn-helix transcriptional regulator [Candidatus Lindowbacteria bacterium]|nr:helix-turn-helix transcriptional regulator [Candidatus Lindowbacteria bacterium]
MKTTAIKERIKTLRGAISQGEFAQRIGAPQSLLSQVESGRRRPSLDFLWALKKALGVSIDWVLTGEGEPYASEEKTAYIIEEYGRESMSAEQTAVYYETKTPLRVIGAASANPDGSIKIKELEHRCIELGRVHAIRVADDCMVSAVQPGQWILVAPEEDLRDGDLAILKVRGKGALFKRVFFRKGRIVELHSDNRLRPQPSISIRREDIIEHYRVRGVIYE